MNWSFGNRPIPPIMGMVWYKKWSHTYTKQKEKEETITIGNCFQYKICDSHSFLKLYRELLKNTA